MPYISPQDAEVMSNEFKRVMESREAEYGRLEKIAGGYLSGKSLDNYLAALGDTRTKCVKYYSAMMDVLRHGSPWIPFEAVKPRPYERCLFISEHLMFEGTMTESGTVSRNGADDYEKVLDEKIVSWIPVPDVGNPQQG